METKLTRYLIKTRECINKYGGALALPTLPLLTIEYASLFTTGEHFWNKLSTFESIETIAVTFLVHAPLGYVLGVMHREDAMYTDDFKKGSDLEEKIQ